MTTSDSAKKGFRTFVLTLSVSLIIFSVIYYFVTNRSQDTDSSGDYLSENTVGESVAVKDESPFAPLAYKKVEATPYVPVNQAAPAKTKPAVLAATDTAATTPQTTGAVPNGGITEITIGLILSAVIFGAAMYWNKMNPRRLAITGFERRILQDLDESVKYTSRYKRY